MWAKPAPLSWGICLLGFYFFPLLNTAMTWNVGPWPHIPCHSCIQQHLFFEEAGSITPTRGY